MKIATAMARMIEAVGLYARGLGRKGFPRLLGLEPQPWGKGQHVLNPPGTDLLMVPCGKPYAGSNGTTVVLVATFQLGVKV